MNNPLSGPIGNYAATRILIAGVVVAVGALAVGFLVGAYSALVMR